VGTIGDVTERKREAEGLHASERRFRVLTERSWDAVSLVSAEGVILYDNPAASTRILGYATGELVGQSAFAQLHPDDQERIGRLFAELVEQPGATVTADFRHRHKDGSWRWIECTGTNLLAEPSVHAIVCNYRDITDQKRAEEEIKRRNRELLALNTVTAAVSSTLELPVVLNTFKRLVTEELSVPAGMTYLHDPDEGRLKLQDSWGLPCPVPDRLTDFPLVDSDYDRIVHEKKALLVPDFRRISHLLELGLDVARPEWKSFLCVPLLANDCIQGAIGLFCQQPFVEEQVPVFEALGREVGVAIQNARLFEQVRRGQEQLETLSRRLVELQETERRHIARELHDEVGQLLTGLKLSLEVATRGTRNGDHEHLSEALRQVTELIARVRDLSLDLRPAMLDDLGLLPALLWHFDRYSAQTGIRIFFEHTGLERRFSPAIETAAYRIVQEALTNVARHGGVREVTVSLWAQGQHLAVEVYDRGRGFDPQKAWRVGGTSGLLGMRERAVLLGGELSVSSVKGRGTQLLALLPIDQPE
jgi:PAS domain S-box-containing protein